jgi:arylsulfatase A-like enzyme
MLRKHGYQTGLSGKWHMKQGGKKSANTAGNSSYGGVYGGKPANPGKAGFDRFVFKTGAGGPYYKASGYLQNPSFGSTKIEKKSYKGYITDNFTNNGPSNDEGIQWQP